MYKYIIQFPLYLPDCLCYDFSDADIPIPGLKGFQILQHSRTLTGDLEAGKAVGMKLKNVSWVMARLRKYKWVQNLTR